MRDGIEDSPIPLGERHQIRLSRGRPLNHHRVVKPLAHGCYLPRISSTARSRLLPPPHLIYCLERLAHLGFLVWFGISAILVVSPRRSALHRALVDTCAAREGVTMH